jgi:type II restriction/modification system DNA methylase subunit YeeA
VTPETFIKKWKASTLTERAASQSHFLDLCSLLDEQTPTDSDPTGETYAFERGATKTTGGEGWADVWKRGCFAWEYKGKRKDLKTAYAQLQQYAVALENPPLLVVCDMETIEIHTNWTNTVHQIHRLGYEDLREVHHRATLKAVFSNPDKLKPGETRQGLTEKAAQEFAGLAHRLRSRGHAPQAVAHFVNRLVFCMFAEDVGLLPANMFQRMLEQGVKRPDHFAPMATQLFAAMRTGGLVGFEEVAWFNGGLFDDDQALAMEKEDLGQALSAARLDWAEIDPSILGTLFERGLDPDKRSQLGAHYTDRDKIMQIVGPVVVAPLTREWDTVRQNVQELMAKAEKAKSGSARTKARNDAWSLCVGFLERLKRFRVLDPACGSGNFLYLALLALKDLEHRVNLDCEVMGFSRQFPSVGPEAVRGIEINPYAAELARVSVWIGEIQWMQRNGFAVSRNPILKALDNIECRDAVLNPDGTEAEWPEADAIIGNPPFLGDKSMLSTLGEEYTTRLRAAYAGRVAGAADLVCYWFEKTGAMMASGSLAAAGLVTTQAIRRGASRVSLDRIAAIGTIYNAWSDEPWNVEGAAVRVSLICFARKGTTPAYQLDGLDVLVINPDLTGGELNLTQVRRLPGNLGVCFQGPVKVGPFDVPGTVARQWLTSPLNPNGRPNSDVVRPLLNGMDITRRPSDTWIIDFGEMSEECAALYEGPFEYVKTHVKPIREANRDRQRREKWWRLGRSGGDLSSATQGLSRVILTPRVSKHRFFVWGAARVLPDSRVNAITRDDDVIFGILQSRFHEAWSLRLGGWHGVGNDPQYTPTTGFETFPFPTGLTPDLPAGDYATNPFSEAIAKAARRLNELRGNWLNPSDLVKREPEVVPGYPERICPASAAAAEALRNRTLTNLYNERPKWLANAHDDLDKAVAAAYAWPEDISDELALANLFSLNQATNGPILIPGPATDMLHP